MGDAGGHVRAEGEGGAGTLALALLADPANVKILQALARGPWRVSELRDPIDLPSQGELRSRLEGLAELGVVARVRRSLFAGGEEYELSALAGRELLFVARTMEEWLASAPDRALSLESEAARRAIACLVESWSSTMLRAMAPGPASAAQLDAQVAHLSREALERRLGALRRAGLVAASGGEAYEITDLLRKATGPLAAAARWERRHLPELTARLRPVDAEAGFLLAMPLLRPAQGLAGCCRLSVEFGAGRGGGLAGVSVEVGEGRILSCTTQLAASPDAWASGPPEAWLRTAIESNPGRLELGGKERLVRGLVDDLNKVLFGPARPLSPRS